MTDPKKKKKKKQVKTRDLSKPLTASTWDKYVDIVYPKPLRKGMKTIGRSAKSAYQEVKKKFNKKNK